MTFTRSVSACLRLLCLPVVFGTVLGCGGDKPIGGPENLVPVEGTVSLDGKPIANASIVFTPKGSGGASTGYTDSSGHYELFYGASATGAIPGEHTVMIEIGEGEEPTVPEDVDTSGMSEDEVTKLMDKLMREAVTSLPKKYSDGSAPLTATVSEGGDPIDFALTSE